MFGKGYIIAQAFEAWSLITLKLSLSGIEGITRCNEAHPSHSLSSECHTATSKRSTSCFDMAITEDKRGYKALEGHRDLFLTSVLSVEEKLLSVKLFTLVFLVHGNSNNVK